MGMFLGVGKLIVMHKFVHLDHFCDFTDPKLEIYNNYNTFTAKRNVGCRISEYRRYKKESQNEK